MAFAANGRGQAAGQADTATLDGNGEEYVSVAFVADAGGMSSLGAAPGFAHSQALAINDPGIVAGWSDNQDPDNPGVTLPGFRATVWGRAGAHEIGTLGGSSSIAYGINNRGQVVAGPAPEWATTLTRFCTAPA
jgi:uncharacterized membrane protein